MPEDRGLPLSTTSAAARDAYIALVAACIKADRPEAASALIEQRAHLPRLLDVPRDHQ